LRTNVIGPPNVRLLRKSDHFFAVRARSAW
jgi:hypothetical protein